jgi:hypothetical protein
MCLTLPPTPLQPQTWKHAKNHDIVGTREVALNFNWLIEVAKEMEGWSGVVFNNLRPNLASMNAFRTTQQMREFVEIWILLRSVELHETSKDSLTWLQSGNTQRNRSTRRSSKVLTMLTFALLRDLSSLGNFVVRTPFFFCCLCWQLKLPLDVCVCVRAHLNFCFCTLVLFLL